MQNNPREDEAMKTIIPIVLTLCLTLFVTDAMADRGQRNNNQRHYTSQGERVERHLDNQGDRIERRFEHKAHRAAERGNYRKAAHFQKKGKQINRHMDRKGERIHARLDRRVQNHQREHRAEAYTRNSSRRYNHNNVFSVMIQQPGFVLGWGWHH